MAGHSKWANIKRRKGAQDAARGKLFTKLIREITVAARMGGGDINSNARLRVAVDKAKANSMPRDNIARAIAKGSGDLDTDSYEEIQFEGYGAGGVAVMVQILSDNRNRVAAEVRHAFAKNGGNLGTTGCVGYMFQRRGLICVPAEGVDEDDIMMAALEGGADDITLEGDQFEVVCEPNDFEPCRDALQEAGFALSSAEVTYIPDNEVSVAGKQLEQVMRLVDTLEDNDDVQNVYTNADFSDEEVERLSR